MPIESGPDKGGPDFNALFQKAKRSIYLWEEGCKLEIALTPLQWWKLVAKASNGEFDLSHFYNGGGGMTKPQRAATASLASNFTVCVIKLVIAQCSKVA